MSHLEAGGGFIPVENLNSPTAYFLSLSIHTAFERPFFDMTKKCKKLCINTYMCTVKHIIKTGINSPADTEHKNNTINEDKSMSKQYYYDLATRPHEDLD